MGGVEVVCPDVVCTCATPGQRFSRCSSGGSWWARWESNPRSGGWWGLWESNPQCLSNPVMSRDQACLLPGGTPYWVMSTLITSCLVCGKTLAGKQTKFCSKSCKNSGGGANNYSLQQERAWKRKKVLVEKLGGACQICGYSRNLAALEFHHVDPSGKSMNLDSRSLSNSSMVRILAELNKCVLLCANCHREVHHPLDL